MPRKVSRRSAKSASRHGRGSSRADPDSIFKELNRHCEPTGRANAGPMTGSAKQSIAAAEMDCFAALAMASKHTFTFPPRNAPEPLMNLPPKEGVGNAGCPWHPRPRVHFVVVERTRVNEYTGIIRRSRTQWF